MAKKLAQKEILELAALFKSVFASMVEGIIVYDLHGKILHLNTVAQKLLEFHPEAGIDMYYHQLTDYIDISEERHQLFSTEPRSARCILRGEVITPVYYKNMPIQLASGHEIRVDITDIPVSSQQGALIGGLTMFRDVTEQCEKVQRTLQAFTCLLELVEGLAALPRPVLDNEIITIGEVLATISAYVLDARYVDVFILEPPDDRQYLLGVSGLAPEEEQHLRDETNQTPLANYISADAIARLHDNQEVILDLKLQAYITPRSDFGARYRLLAPMVLHERLIGLLIIAKNDVKRIDVCNPYTHEEIALARSAAKLTTLFIERIRLLQEWAETHANELALQETNKRYDAFLSLASHELRTPLTTVKGNIQLAQRRMDKWQQQNMCTSIAVDDLKRIQQPLEYAVQKVNAQERIISEMLDISRIRANKLTMILRSCNLASIVQSTVNDTQRTASDRTILLFMPENEMIPIMADTDRIGQVVANYLSNALKYSDIASPVEVHLKYEGSKARVEVRDTGPGLSQEEQAHIWELFYRAPGIEVQYGSETGLGLGLHLCRTIIEYHQGQVGVESAPDAGSTFWFTLPTTRAEQQ